MSLLAVIGEKAKAEGEFGSEDESERELFGSINWVNVVVGDVGSLGLLSPSVTSRSGEGGGDSERGGSGGCDDDSIGGTGMMEMTKISRLHIQTGGIRKRRVS